MLSNQGGPAWPDRRLVRLGHRSGRCSACPASTSAGWSSRRASTRTNSGRSRLAITCPVGRCTEPPLHCLPSEGGRVVRIPLIPNRVRPGLCHGQVAYDDLCGAQRPLQPVSYTHLRAHETVLDLVCRLLLEKKKPNTKQT